MDKQTAIDLLDNLLGMVEDNHDSDYDTAIKMGIDAIKEKIQLSKEDATKGTTFDCISRQAAIDAILAIKDYGNSDRANALGLAECAVTTLPSVQPEKTQLSEEDATKDAINDFLVGFIYGAYVRGME